MIDKLNISAMGEGSAALGGALLCSVKERTAKNGRQYCVFSLSDGQQTVEAKLFDSSLDSLPDWAKERRVAKVALKADMFNGALSYVIQSLKPLVESEYDIGDYVKKAPLDSQLMFDAILAMLAETAPEAGEFSPISELVRRIYEDHKEQLIYWSAAKTIHHSMYGGLLYHTYRMMLTARKIAPIYPELDRQLLLAGVALHDIGKLKELHTDALGTADYSLEGQLFSHSLIGVEMIDTYADDSFDPDEIACLKHCIASHHGCAEYGAIVLPRILEAQVLNCLDLLDSRIEQYERAYEALDFGAVSPDKLYGLDNVQVYKPEYRSRRPSKEETPHQDAKADAASENT